MTEQIKIPKILQENEKPGLIDQVKERTVEFRKRVSAKMARVVVGITFNKSEWLAIDNETTDQDKIDQDTAFATYEENLRESHYQQVHYRARRLGSLAMTLPGLYTVGEIVSDSKLSKSRRSQRRADWKARNDTMKSNLRKRYVAHATKYPK